MLTLIEKELDRVLPSAQEEPTLLHQAMRYAVFSGGKRLRPLLCLGAAEAAGGDPLKAIPAAAALELLHSYTLIHDDLPAMDDDDLRRGKPTVHKAFDEATAILAGDALLTLAFEVLAQSNNPRLVYELSVATGSRGTIGGQEVDILSTAGDITETMLEYIHLNKTAKLFEVSVRIGGILAGANEAVLSALSLFGRHLGLAYQLVDDLVDSDEKTLQIYTPADLVIAARKHFAAALSAISSLPGNTELLRTITSKLAQQVPQQQQT